MTNGDWIRSMNDEELATWLHNICHYEYGKDDVMEIVQNEDGTFSAYDDTYDVVIHCETEEEQKKVIERLKATSWIPASERL